MNTDTEHGTPRKRPTAYLRFTDPEHHELILECARDARMSLNAWICRATLEVARREAAKIARFKQAMANR